MTEPTVRGPVAELRAFLRAALLDPVPVEQVEGAAVVRRRRIVAGLTLLVGTVLLAWALRIEPGDPTFYTATLALAVVWVVGSFASGPLHLGKGHTRSGGLNRPVLQSLALSALLVGIFVVGALVVLRIPFLAQPVRELLDHADAGSLPLVAVLTCVNGIAEELYFRGALFAALPRHHAVAITTAVYAMVSATTGIALLVVAGLALGTVVGLQRRVTGGVLGPMVTHVVFTLAMLFLLPVVLERFGG